MKRKSIIVIALFCSMFLLNVSASIKPDKINDAADEIALSREGGTTRSPETTMTTRSFAIQAAPVEVSAESDGDVVSINAQNYRGGVWVEIVGRKLKPGNTGLYYGANGARIQSPHRRVWQVLGE